MAPGQPDSLWMKKGAVTLSVSYTPWGDTMEIYGSGMLNLGYLGGIYDAGTGLIYMGNGQYYDPSTGRFLTRGAQQDQSNPYTPWNSDPAGMLIAPLALLVLVFGRKKTRTKFDQFIILFVIVVSVGLSVSACTGGTPSVIPTPLDPPSATKTQEWIDEANRRIDGTATAAAEETETADEIIPTVTSTPTATPAPNKCALDEIINPYPTIDKSTFKFTSMPFKTSWSFSWGFGNNTEYLSDPTLAYYAQETGDKHTGMDFFINVGTNLYWTGNKPAIYWGNHTSDFSLPDYNIVLEVDGFYVIYGHTNGVTEGFQIGETIQPDIKIGQSGTFNNTPHLHLEIRPIDLDLGFSTWYPEPQDPTDETTPTTTPELIRFYGWSRGCYINPLTFFDDSLFTAFADDIKGSDYANDDDFYEGYYEVRPGNCPANR